MTIRAQLVCPRCGIADIGWRLQRADNPHAPFETQPFIQLRCPICDDVILVRLASNELDSVGKKV